MIPYHSLADQQLLTLLKMGDNRAFTELYERNWEHLYQLAFRILQDRETSLDLVQEIFIWLWENRQRLQVNSFNAYLKMAVRYKVANAIRHDKVKGNVLKKMTESQGTAACALESVELKELKEVIAQFTEQLPERCREIFKLSRNEWLSNPEIAKKLQVSEKTVENQITIALKKLRMHLTKYTYLFFFLL